MSDYLKTKSSMRNSAINWGGVVPREDTTKTMYNTVSKNDTRCHYLDTAKPQPRGAGINTKVNAEGEGTQNCLEIENRPPTPEGVRRYRKTFHSEPGTRIVHYGLIEDMKKQNKLQKYGQVTLDSDHVEDVFQSMGPRTPYEEYAKEQAEAIYDSHKKEPLGVSYNRHHVLPEETKNPDFAFGIPSGTSDDAKDLMYPRVTQDASVHKEMYIKSHGSYEAAEQRNRNYEWGKTEVKDPANFKFGLAPQVLEKNGVGKCLDNRTDPSVNITRITHTRVEKQKALKDQLGRCRNLGSSVAPSSEHTFGVTGGFDAWGAKKCIEGEYTHGEQMPDSDLGRATQIGWRNTSCETRSFGIPSVRTDIAPPRGPRGRGIADNNNYGDDSDCSAAFLINPDQYAACGVDDAEFAAPMSREDIRELFDGSGYSVTDEEFERIWSHAQGMGISRRGDVCVEEYRRGLNAMMDAKEDGVYAQWLRSQSDMSEKLCALHLTSCER